MKETCDESGFAAFQEKFFPNLGRSRTYELLAIGTGKKSVEEVRASTRERVARYRASKAASVTVTDNTKPLQETDQERRDREECVALYQKVLDAEREQAQWLAEHPRATSAEVSAEATERPARGNMKNSYTHGSTSRSLPNVIWTSFGSCKPAFRT